MARRRDDLVVSPRDKAIAAVKAGNKEEALKWIQDSDQLSSAYHDRAVEFMTFLVDFIAGKLGEEAIEGAWGGLFEAVLKDRWVENFKSMTAEDVARHFARVHIGHGSDVTVDEDDDKFVVNISNCGTGGRMQKLQKGGKVSKAYSWSYGQTDVTYYCTHEAIFERMFKKWGYDRIKYEHARQFDEKGKATGGACRYIVFKGKP